MMNLRLTHAEADTVWSELCLKALSYKRWADYEGLPEEQRQTFYELAWKTMHLANKIGDMLGYERERFDDN